MSHDFHKYTQKQDLQRHIDCFKSLYGDRITIQNVSEKHQKNKDLIIKSAIAPNGVTVECKTDNPNTGNLCFELIGVCFDLLGNPEYQANSTGPFPPGSKQHSFLTSIFEKKIREGLSKGDSFGFCFDTNKPKGALFSTMRPPSNKWYVFTQEKLSSYIKNNYHRMKIIVTHSYNKQSGDEWHTISVLATESEIEKNSVHGQDFPQRISDLIKR